MIAMLLLVASCTKQQPNASEGRVGVDRWQAVYSNPEGDSWSGPVRDTADEALADANHHGIQHPQRQEAILVVAVPDEMPTGALPPNPMARRDLEVEVRATSVAARWDVIESTVFQDALNQERTIEFFLDGSASSNLPWPRWLPDQPGSWEILNDSSFAYFVGGGGGGCSQ